MESSLHSLLVGLSVQISRSDGRVHLATVKSVDAVKSTAMMEWHERKICRAKEVDVSELYTLNPELLDHIIAVTIKDNDTPLPAPDKKYEGRLRSSRIPAPASYGHVLSVCLLTACLLPKASAPAVTHAEKSGRRKTLAPQELNKGSKRLSCVVKPPDMQTKRGKFGEASRPNQKFYDMIQDFRETLEVTPLSTTDRIEPQKISVCVRKRPLNKQEIIKKEIDVVSVPGKGVLLVHEPKHKVDLTKYLENQVFHFDYSFDETTTNDLVYKFTAKPLVQSVFEGGMATCFAYGQTGSGKTHTMGGDFIGKQQNSTKGIYAFAAQDVFTYLNHRRYANLELSAYVSFFEIYNGKVYDLLNKKAKLRVMEDDRQQVQVVGLEEVYVSTAEEVIKMIQMGSACRTSGQTSANANSSRSHAVLQIVLRRNDRATTLHGKFSLVDLAGNERGTDVSSNDRSTLVETAEINRSLLALKECIRSLGMNSDHIPFRMSTLTKVLRDSFIGEKSRICMESVVDSSVYDAMAQVAELEEKAYVELKAVDDFVKAMEQTSYNIKEGLPNLVAHSRKILAARLSLTVRKRRDRDGDKVVALFAPRVGALLSLLRHVWGQQQRREEDEDAVCDGTSPQVSNLRVFEEYTQALYQRYPDIRIEGENYLPIPLYRHIASFLSMFKLLVIGVIIIGKDPFALFGMQAPGIWEWGQGNKIYACMMVFFLSNMIENQLMSTGAFEITLNDVPVWSKLESGHLPSMQQLVQILDNEMKMNVHMNTRPHHS
ncbi:Kinesin-like protein KIF2C [Collichthys lucidus]|uniref:Kinesin-like protein n=1 Tax=Collichthys lucidus TaxID=240159 RepID=A0A4U5UY49_COLLU|nr:Kinesin-like protein KIF2C [Collichthys lucidus]